FATAKSPWAVNGGCYKPGKSYEVNWTRVTGNRVAAGGGGWEESSKVVAEAQADASGRLELRLKTPDDLGGLHGLWIDDGAQKKSAMHWIAPNAFPLDISRGP